jgi:zona occludens toxin (predicted ATPase)
MVKFYSGTPGSGKSYHTAKEIWNALRTRRRNVISTVNIDTNKISRNGKKKIGDFVYIPITELTVRFLYQYAIQNHKKGKEGQTLLVIDECQIIYNTRDCQDKENKKSRIEWILFFSRHRHLGYDVILISQQDRMLDRQIRGMFEYEYKHRKVNNYSVGWLIPFTIFVVIQYWYGAKLRCGSEFVIYRRKVGKIYDSYTMYDDYLEEFRDKETTPTVPIGAPAEIEPHETEEIEAFIEEVESSPLAHADGGRGSPSEGARGSFPTFRKIANFFAKLFKNPIKNAPLKT